MTRDRYSPPNERSSTGDEPSRPRSDTTSDRAESPTQSRSDWVTEGDRPAYTVGMFREVFDLLDDALLVTDPEQGVIETCNPRACSLLGYDHDALVSLSPADVFDGDGETYETFVASVGDRGAGRTDDLVCRTHDGQERPVEVSVAVVEFDREVRMLWRLHDNTARLEREFTLRQQAAAMESAIDGMAITDVDGTYIYVNQAHAEMYGYDSPDDLVGTSWRDLYDEATRDRHDEEVVPALERHGYWRGESVGRRADGTTFEQDLSLATVNGGSIVGVVRDISDRKAAERQLQALNWTSRDLLSAESDEEIAGHGIDAVERIVGFPIGCIRLFDLASNRFDIVAQTDETERLMQSRPAFSARATHAGRAYRRGETVLETELVDADAPDDAIRSSLHVPLGEYGVLSVLTTGEESISERDVYLVERLASDIATVFEHTRRERLLSDHERELLFQRDRLQALDEINGVIREIIHRLPTAATREEVGEIVCRCLVGSELYRHAWIVTTEADSTVTVTSGTDETATGSDRDVALPRPSPAGIEDAFETGELQVTRQYSVTQNDPVDAEHAEFEAVLAVPVANGGHVEDVLVVATDRTDAFSESEQAEFELLGQMIGFVVSFIATRKLLIADSVVELDFEVVAGTDVFVDLSARFDCVCSVEESVPVQGRRLLQYATVEGTHPDRVAEFVSAREDVETRRILDRDDETGLFELVVSSSPIHDLLDLGATVRSMVAEHGTGRIVLAAPADVDVRTLADVLRSHYDRVALVAKHERPRPVETSAHSIDVLDEWLTDRQRTAIRVAYAAGYYDWPRKSTAEEVAASLGITSATLHQHLRKAEEKLLRASLTDDHVVRRPRDH